MRREVQATRRRDPSGRGVRSGGRGGWGSAGGPHRGPRHRARRVHRAHRRRRARQRGAATSRRAASRSRPTHPSRSRCASRRGGGFIAVAGQLGLNPVVWDGKVGWQGLRVPMFVRVGAARADPLDPLLQRVGRAPGEVPAGQAPRVGSVRHRRLRGRGSRPGARPRLEAARHRGEGRGFPPRRRQRADQDGARQDHARAADGALRAAQHRGRAAGSRARAARAMRLRTWRRRRPRARSRSSRPRRPKRSRPRPSRGSRSIGSR